MKLTSMAERLGGTDGHAQRAARTTFSIPPFSATSRDRIGLIARRAALVALGVLVLLSGCEAERSPPEIREVVEERQVAASVDSAADGDRRPDPPTILEEASEEADSGTIEPAPQPAAAAAPSESSADASDSFPDGEVASVEPATGRYFLYVSNEYDASISVIDTATDQVVDTIRISGRPGEVRPRGMAVGPSGQLIYVSISDFFPLQESPEDKIAVIDVVTNEVLVEIPAGGNPERVAISPDGSQVWAALEAIAQGGGFDTETGERLATFQTGVEPEGVAVSPDGRWVYVTAETTHSVSVFDRPALTPAGHFVVGNRPRDVLFSVDGSRAYVSAEIGGVISVVDVAQHRVADEISLGLDSRPVEMALAPDGGRLYVAGGGTSAVYVIDTASNEVIATIRERMGRRPWGIAVTPDGRKVYTADGLSDSVTVIDTECLCVVGSVSAGRGPHSVEVGVLPGVQ